MNYYYLEPEVAGGFGNKTILDNSTHPPIVTRLHYEFSGWLEDDIIESFPCFIINEGLVQKFQSSNITGFQIDNVLITKSEQFNIASDKKLPNFKWLKITGKKVKDDFYLSSNHQLVVSEKVYTILKKFNIKYCEVKKI